MKILLIHNQYQIRGGEEHNVKQIKELLEEKGHSVILYMLDNLGINSFSFWQRLFLPLQILFSFKSYREVINLIKNRAPDIAHIHNIFPLISPSIYYALKRMNVPVVQTVHNYRLLCPNGLFLNNEGKICEKCKRGNFFNAVIGKCYRNSYIQTFGMVLTLYLHRKLKTFTNKIDVFISPSNFLKKKLIEGGIPEEKIVIKPHFTKCKEVKPSYEFDNCAVYMGRLSREKGLFTLLKTWEEIPDITLKIMGNGPIRSELENFVIQKGITNVEFLGFIGGPKRFEVLKKAMFLIFSSECYENFPYAIIESFACGTPVIASRIGAVAELIKEGITGFLFEPGNPNDLLQKISMSIGNKELLLKMKHNARKLAEEQYSENIGYKNLMKVYQKAKSIAGKEEF